MILLTIGDVVGKAAVTYLAEHLRTVRDTYRADMVLVNGENATDIHGLGASDAHRIADAGADLITLGNHTYGMHDLHALLEDDGFPMIRPANYPPAAPGYGYRILNVNGYRVLCINVSGVVYLEPLADPFDTVEKILAREVGKYDFATLDIHAEATSEKYALARSFDGKIAVIYGTHTHVQTADEQVLPGGSGYITDLGMTGPVNGILGTDAAAVINKFRTHLPTRFTPADGPISAAGALFDVEESSGRVRRVQRIVF